jgi:hypothetical protein
MLRRGKLSDEAEKLFLSEAIKGYHIKPSARPSSSFHYWLLQDSLFMASCVTRSANHGVERKRAYRIGL